MKTILLDVDDVTVDLITVWLSLYNEKYNDNITEHEIETWDISHYVKCGDDIYNFLKNYNLYDTVIPVTGAIEGIEYLRELEFRVVFVTASTPEQSGRKYKLLMDYEILDNRKNYIEALDKSLVIGDYLIDDNPDNVINAFGQGIVFTKPWNKNLTGYPRVSNWNDIVEYFARVANEMEMTGV